ncbi:hypothetical protein [Paenibacillus sp. IHBB 3054]|uniref:hypothetical protein n=1 Tax=Paenibacillus sp. IHBB 3054 TaxID=3425689 RepID=UPI003F6701F5
MSMTPERIEEIKALFEASELIDWHTLRKVTKELLAALEEAEQQLRRTQITSSVHEGNSDSYFAECERLRGKLAEAQQTIARQREALGWYELGKPELAWAALGNKEGKKQP